VSAAVRLQAAARGLLARRRLHEMRRQMHEASLTAIDLGKGGRVLAPPDGHQQSRGSAAVYMREQGVVSTVGELQLCGSGSFRFVTGEDAQFSATTFRYRPP